VLARDTVHGGPPPGRLACEGKCELLLPWSVLLSVLSAGPGSALKVKYACRAKERSRGTCGIPKCPSPSSKWSQRRTKDQSNLGLQIKGVRTNPDQPGTSTAHHAILTRRNSGHDQDVPAHTDAEAHIPVPCPPESGRSCVSCVHKAGDRHVNRRACIGG